MCPARELTALETAFKALADATRLRILALLSAGEICVCHLHESLGVPQPTASRHLAYLRRAGLVEARRQGIWMHYRIATDLDPVVRTVLDAATHALSHVPSTAKDLRRLEKETGAPAAAAEPAAAPACCGGVVRLARLLKPRTQG